VRLAALREAPYAFGSTFEAEVGASEEMWRAAIVERARFVAELGGEVIGTVGGGPSGTAGNAALTALWVDPRVRGQGAGARLVRAVLDWAKDAGYKEVLLWVTDGNADAERLYERHGFKRTGEVMAVRPGEARLEYEMSRPL